MWLPVETSYIHTITISMCIAKEVHTIKAARKAYQHLSFIQMLCVGVAEMGFSFISVTGWYCAGMHHEYACTLSGVMGDVWIHCNMTRFSNFILIDVCNSPLIPSFIRGCTEGGSNESKDVAADFQ